jgi:hypothetical protein
MMTDWHRMPVDRQRPPPTLESSEPLGIDSPGRDGRGSSAGTPSRIQRDLATPAAAATFPGGDRDRGSPASDSGADGD